MKVEHWDPDSDGPLTESALRGKLEARGYDVACYHYPPGTFFDWHSHSVDKIDAVLEGSFRIRMSGGVVVLGPGDAVFVPSGESHRAEDIGDTTVVSLDAVRD